MKGFSQFFQRFHPLSKLQHARQQYLMHKDCPAILQPLLQFPCPNIEDELEKLTYLVIDFETTGLNSMIDNILSIAALPIDHLRLDLSQAWHLFIDEPQVNPETVVVNHILPQMLNGAEQLDEAMHKLFSLMAGRIVIAHGANIEKRFIQHYLATRYQITHFPLIWLDTLKIERSFMSPQTNVSPNYQLATIRKNYSLPDYINHNALIDAIATGELFLAQIHKLFGSQTKYFGEVYKRSL
ncbi:3'-5' exonuclease [Avibacterium gallinarum]|uniref:DNA polymerase-3 subunit epsilon n=1 Tax=Avibacterium gallinarum TaxID=755 RepID=A0A379AZV9_AVIGA|nr:exonuclease domain-containing protein [Avibacterium gallinarum]POY44388.1 3'-5' exonuclease [Avibacterium gallinarum]TDP28153.1 DNA polymerase-3 subunit epsilon [Avibacterium gallinarum]SUB27903.1 ribonuclease T [Avibacterium gallinarum]